MLQQNETVNTPSGDRFDVLKWGVSIVLLVIAVLGNAHFSEEPFLYRLAGVLLLIGGSIYILASTAKGRMFILLLKDARAETRRIAWPSKHETLVTAGVVLLAVVVSALVLWAIDSMLGAFVSYLVA